MYNFFQFRLYFLLLLWVEQHSGDETCQRGGGLRMELDIVHYVTAAPETYVINPS